MKNKILLTGLLCLALLLAACSSQKPNAPQTPADEGATTGTQTPEKTESGENGETTVDPDTVVKPDSTKPGDVVTAPQTPSTKDPAPTAPSTPEKENTAGQTNNAPAGKDEPSETPATPPTVGTITEIPDDPTTCTYDEYHNMTPETQVKFLNEFKDMEAFFDWYKAAKATYEKENGAIETDGEINLDGIINSKK